jgi:predicted nucleic acid-binding Zn ribbon protein
VTADQPGTDDPMPGEPTESRQDDGLDLARAITRATRGSARARRAYRRREYLQRPVGPGVSGAHPDDRDPQALTDMLGKLVVDQGWEVDLNVQGIFGRWSELVGGEVSAHSVPESFNDGRLVVRTDSTAWATQLRLLAPMVIRTINEHVGHGTVRVIEVLGPRGPSWKKGPRSVRDGRGPRDTYG